MNRIELLSPVGDFNCLIAAVQNGADSVYFGADLFSARAFASNFDLENLEKAINYAKMRNVKTHLTLNTLIKNSEFKDAIFVANKAYEFGIDAIIVQDLGLAKFLIDNYHDLPIHASTQMTIHNLDGAIKLQKMGFKRAVLARELSLNEISNICKNTNIEIETFIHGALCVCYSGQCLFSSMIGGRSGNRGKCAQPCRQKYDLIRNNSSIDNGYLLSTKDLCGLEFLPDLIHAGVSSFKIEGRMKNPEYVATVTRIYRKYIDMILNDEPYIIDDQDKKDLLQVFNRGGFSSGYLNNTPNRELVYPLKPNNMGIYLGKILKYNSKKGYITVKLEKNINIGDTLSIQRENNKYSVSELMIKNKNIKYGNIDQIVEIGRIKGDIRLGDNIYKLSDKLLFDNAKKTYINSPEIKKINIDCKISIKKNLPITLEIKYDDINIFLKSDVIPEDSINSPITEEKITALLNKTNNTPFKFNNIEIDLDDNLFVQKLSKINELRRNGLSKLENKLISKFKRTSNIVFNDIEKISKNITGNKKISLLLNILDNSYDYSLLNKTDIDRIYIPLKFFVNSNYFSILEYITNNFKTYIYLPLIMKDNYNNIFKNNIDRILNDFQIHGIVISNLGNFELIKEYIKKYNLDIIGNYTLNIFNNYTINELIKLGLSSITLSPELNSSDILDIINTNKLSKELIIYGNTPVMTSNYCLIGKTNKCYNSCNSSCKKGNYFLKDKLGFNFKVLPDNIETITTIYNSKITSISHKDFDLEYIRLDILDETIEEINKIISTVKIGNKLEGKDYTNGNINREV